MSNQSLARIMYGSSEEVRSWQSKPAAWTMQSSNAGVAVQHTDESAFEKLWHKAWNALLAK